MASGQIVGLCLISMFLVCGAIAAVHQLRRSCRLKREAVTDAATHSGGAFQLDGLLGRFEPSLAGEDDGRAAFKDSWQNGVWQTGDGRPAFTDRAFS